MKTKHPLLLLAMLLSMPLIANEKANEFYQIYHFDKAIEAYRTDNKLDVGELRNLAKSLHNRHRYAEAEAVYARFISTPYAETEDYFQYALLLRSNGKYKDAGVWTAKLREANPNDLRALNFAETEHLLAEWQRPNRDYRITLLDFNNKEDDFGAAFYGKNGVVFASSRRSLPLFKRLYNWTQRAFLKLYIADVDDAVGERSRTVKWKNLHYFDKGINEKWHEASASFSADDSLMAFTRNNYSDSLPDDVVRLQIYFIKKDKNNKWGEPVPFPLNSPAYSVGHPALVEGGMYFASDMPGGTGGTDIYYIARNADGTWGAAQNLGTNINTEGNELFPFFSGQRLYFASNGLNGLGGLDVFSAGQAAQGFEKAQNIGAPVNSRYDDFAYIVSGKMGYFSSNRPGKGGDDIYHFSFGGEVPDIIVPPAPEIMPEDKSFIYRLFVLNEHTRQPVAKANAALGDVTRQLTDKRGMISHIFTDTVSFIASANAIGYNRAEKQVVISTFKNRDIIADTLYLAPAVGQRIVLKNIYYDFDKSDILPESAEELDKLVDFMLDNPGLKVELSSHTDSRGSDAYNMHLSDLRAKSAVSYIRSKGIAADRITAKGYGETRHRNRCANGIDCTEEEHRDNRRTEIFISEYGAAQHIKQQKGKQ